MQSGILRQTPALVTIPAIVNAEKSGSTQALREGSLGRVMGLDNYMSQGIHQHTTGITSASAVKVNGAVTAGATTLAIDGTALVGKLVKGDVLTIDGKNYVVTEDSAAAASNAITGVKVYPALPDIKDNADVTLAGSHTANLGFHPSAFAFVTRPLVNPSGVESYVTSYNGVSLRVVKGYNHAVQEGNPVHGRPVRLQDHVSRVGRPCHGLRWQHDVYCDRQRRERIQFDRRAGGGLGAVRVSNPRSKAEGAAKETGKKANDQRR